MSGWDWIPQGALDLHLHSNPCVSERVMDDFEVLEKAKQAGYSGLVIKAHEGSTVERSYLAQKHVGAIHCFGGVVLNEAVGGINPSAVETALQMGGDIVWMPTLSARHHRSIFSKGLDTRGISIIDDNDQLIPQIREILELIKRYDAVLATGHVSKKEMNLLIKEAKRQGIEKIVINHVDFGFLGISFEEQKQYVSQGIYLEKCYLTTLAPWFDITLKEMADQIQTLGEQYCVLVTDLGQKENPDPIDGMNLFCRSLIENGISEKQCEQMLCNNPKKLLGG